MVGLCFQIRPVFDLLLLVVTVRALAVIRGFIFVFILRLRSCRNLHAYDPLHAALCWRLARRALGPGPAFVSGISRFHLSAN